MRNQTGLVLAFSLLLLASPGWAGPCEDPIVDTSSVPALEATAWLVTIPYSVLKGVVALVGGIASVPIYVLSLGNERVTRAVWLPAVSGTFILTPAHLTGQQPIRFLPKCSEG